MALQSSFWSVTQLVSPWWACQSPWDQCYGGKKVCLSIHRCTDVIQLHECWSYLKYPGVSPGLSPSSLGGQGSSVGPRSLLQSSAEPQKAPDASLQAAEEELCMEVRASWGAVTALNQAILCSCQVDAFTSHQGLLLKRGYAGFWCFLFLFFVSAFSVQGYFQPVLNRCLQQGRKHLQR